MTSAPLTIERLASYVDIGDCWQWKMHLNSDGYGRVRWEGVATGAHRAVYQLLVGPIPEGMQLDHLCRNRGCVNPDHLEVVTPTENVRRSLLRSPHHCRNGHKRTSANTFIRHGAMACRICALATQQRYLSRHGRGHRINQQLEKRAER